MVQSLQASVLEARDASGKLLGTLTRFPPSVLPETVYHLAGVPEGGGSFVTESATEQC